MKRRKHMPRIDEVMKVATEEEKDILRSGSLADKKVLEVYENLAERWRQYRVLELMNGTMVVCDGNTYPVRAILKEYLLSWDTYDRTWRADLTVIGGVKMLFKLARDIGAEIKIKIMDEDWIKNASPKKAEAYRNLISIAKKYGKVNSEDNTILVSYTAVRDAWEDMVGEKI